MIITIKQEIDTCFDCMRSYKKNHGGLHCAELNIDLETLCDPYKEIPQDCPLREGRSNDK